MIDRWFGERRLKEALRRWLSTSLERFGLRPVADGGC